MTHHDEDVRAVLQSWTEHTVPPPPAPDQSLRVMAADGCMALRRLIEVVAAHRGAFDSPSPERRRPVPPMTARDALMDAFERGLQQGLEEHDFGAMEPAAFDDDVGGGTQGWMRRLVPNLAPGKSERVYLADQTCALRRVLELLVPVDASVDGEGRLVMPDPVLPVHLDN